MMRLDKMIREVVLLGSLAPDITRAEALSVLVLEAWNKYSALLDKHGFSYTWAHTSARDKVLCGLEWSEFLVDPDSDYNVELMDTARIKRDVLLAQLCVTHDQLHREMEKRFGRFINEEA